MAGEVTYEPEEGDSVAGTWDWYVDSLRRRPFLLRTVGLVLVAASIGAAAAIFDGRSAGEATGAALLFAAGAAVLIPLVMLVLLATVSRRARRLFRQQKAKPAWNRWSWDEEGLGIATPNGEVRYAWDAFTRVRETGKGFLFYFDDQQYVFLPRRCLEGEQARDLAGHALGSLPRGS